MPCDSRITVHIQDMDRLEEAFKALGYVIDTKTKNYIKAYHPAGLGNLVISTRDAIGSIEEVSRVCQKYAEIGVRKYAKRKGYTVSMQGSSKMTLKRGA